MIAVDAFKLMLFGNQTYRRDIAEQHQSLALRAYSPRPIVAIKHKLEPMVTPRGVVMVIITIILTLALDHGGEYPDTMPQAIKLTDAQGRSCIYVPITQNGKVVNSQGFVFDPEDE
jgi:hypothetical protein